MAVQTLITSTRQEGRRHLRQHRDFRPGCLTSDRLVHKGILIKILGRSKRSNEEVE